MAELFDIDALDPTDPFEVDHQVAHLFKHPHLGMDDVRDVWDSDPLFYPAKPPAHWLMVALAPSRTGDPTRCRPIGCYVASSALASTNRKDRS